MPAVSVINPAVICFADRSAHLTARSAGAIESKQAAAYRVQWSGCIKSLPNSLWEQLE
jgi:hypothetical protein